MLGEAVYGLAAPAEIFAVFIIGGLHRIDICSSNVKRQLRILAIRTACAAHNGRSNVDLRSEQRCDACCAVLLSRFLADLRGQLGIHGRRKGYALHKAGDIAGVNGDHSRNTVQAALCHFLDRIGPLCMGAAAVRDRAGNAAASACAQIDSRCIIRRKGLCGEIAIPAAVCQHERLLLALHLLGQVLCALFYGFSPIFIDVQTSVLVQILESKPVFFNDLNA